MLFNSVTYLLVYLPLVFALYWLSPLRVRQWIILTASLTFYAFWKIEFVPLLLFSAFLDYYLAQRIHAEANERTRLLLLRVSVGVNLAVLGFFKYLIFFRDSLWSISEMVGYQPSYTELNIILPLGISFYIFQTMSYTIDVYRREFKPDKDLLTYTCFVTFFPQLVAGPILRAGTLIPQLKTKLKWSGDKLRLGIETILAGLFLKVVLADTVAGFVDQGFARDIASLGGLDGWTLSFLFGFQIYFDFAGYSLIAIGSALVLGFSIPSNFNFPYAATSPRDFWKRWHMSLSTWIRDYLYLPLTGGYRPQLKGGGLAAPTLADDKVKITQARRTWGLFATWAIMGLWHGANWTFVVWGLYHAAIVYIHRLIAPRVNLPNNALTWLLAIGITLPIMMAGWIPFRAASVGDTMTIWANMLNPLTFNKLSLSPNSYFMAAFLVIVTTARYLWLQHIKPLQKTLVLPTFLSTLGHAFVFIMVFVFLEVKQTFIYFQF